MNPPLSPSRVMSYTAAVLVVLAAAWLLVQIASVIAVLILGILLAAAIDPFVYRLRRHGLSRGQAIMTVYGIIGLGVGLTLYIAFPAVIRQGGALIDSIPDILANLEDQADDSENEFISETGANAIERIDEFYTEFQQAPPIEGATAIQFATSTIGLLISAVSVLIVAFYWMTEKAIIKRLILGLFPIQHRDRAHGMWDTIEMKLGGWTRGQAILCGTIGTISGITFSPIFLDLPFWLALALWMGVTEIIPFIGPWLGGSVSAAVALTDSVESAIIVIAFVFVINQLEGAVLVPRVMKNAVGLTPLTVVLAVLVGNQVAGPIGAILAIPVAGAVQVLVQDLLSSRQESLDSVQRDGALAAIGLGGATANQSTERAIGDRTDVVAS